MTFLRVCWLKCLNYGFWTPEFLVTVSNIKADIFSYNNKPRNLCRRGGGGGIAAKSCFSRLSQISPRPKVSRFNKVLKWSNHRFTLMSLVFWGGKQTLLNFFQNIFELFTFCSTLSLLLCFISNCFFLHNFLKSFLYVLYKFKSVKQPLLLYIFKVTLLLCLVTSHLSCHHTGWSCFFTRDPPILFHNYCRALINISY